MLCSAVVIVRMRGGQISNHHIADVAATLHCTPIAAAAAAAAIAAAERGGVNRLQVQRTLPACLPGWPAARARQTAGSHRGQL